MKHYNFTKSFLEWRVYDDYLGRFTIECVIEKNGTPRDNYFLGSGVYACNVLQGEELFKYPSYSFTPLFSSEHFTVFRNETEGKTNHNNGIVLDAYNGVSIFTPEILCSEIFESSSIHDSIKHKLPITGSFTYSLNNSVFTISFPVKHINYRLSDQQFQIETGPIALPYADNMKEWLLGYVAFNNFNTLEFLPLSSTKKNVSLNKSQKLTTNIKLFVPNAEQ